MLGRSWPINAATMGAYYRNGSGEADTASEGEAVEQLVEQGRLAVLEAPDVDLGRRHLDSAVAIAPGATADHDDVVAARALNEALGDEFQHLPILEQPFEIGARLVLAA